MDNLQHLLALLGGHVRNLLQRLEDRLRTRRQQGTRPSATCIDPPTRIPCLTMKPRLCIVLASVVASLSQAAIADTPANALTAAERAAGWHLLFDGTTLSGWRGYRKPDTTGTRWSIVDGAICVPSADG